MSKISNLVGNRLDWAVAVAIGEKNPQISFGGGVCVVSHGHTQHRFLPSEEWSHGGPLIERFKVDFSSNHENGYEARCDNGQATGWQSGPTPLIAICRAVVAATLGETVEMPDGFRDAQEEAKL